MNNHQSAQSLSSHQIEWAKLFKDVAQLKQNITKIARQLHDIHQEDAALSDLSLDDLTNELQHVTSNRSEQDHANQTLAQLIQTEQTNMQSRINQRVMSAEKEACEAFAIERRQSQAAIKDAKKMLADASRLSKQLALEESTLKEQLPALLSAESESAILLSASGTTLNEKRRLWDQKRFLTLSYNDLLVSLTFTSNWNFRYALHWRLGFIEMENKQLCKAINHFNAVMKGSSDIYKDKTKAILHDLKKSFLHNGLGGTPKQLLEKAKNAYQENDYDEVIMYTEQAIDLAKQPHLIEEYTLLLDVYLHQRDWLNVGLIYQKLHNMPSVNNETRVLIDKKIKYALDLRVIMDRNDHYNTIQLLKITSIDVLSTHCAYIKENVIPRADCRRVDLYRALQFKMNTTSPILAGVISLELISLFSRQNELQKMNGQLAWIDSKADIPVFQKAWAHFFVADYLNKQDAYQLAQERYTFALNCLPSLTEAREALDELLCHKTNMNEQNRLAI